MITIWMIAVELWWSPTSFVITVNFNKEGRGGGGVEAHGTRTKRGVMILTPRPTLDSFPLCEAVDKDFATYGGNIPFMSIYVGNCSIAR